MEKEINNSHLINKNKKFDVDIDFNYYDKISNETNSKIKKKLIFLLF